MYRLRQFVQALRSRFLYARYEWEEFDGLIFSFGGTGLVPGRKKRLRVTPLATPVSFDLLVSELSNGRIRDRTLF